MNADPMSASNNGSFDLRWNAVILAGGKGTRMLPLSLDMPKCMLGFKGKPVLNYIVEVFRRANFKEITIVVSYKREKIEENFGDGSKYNMCITYEDADEKGTFYSTRRILSRKKELTKTFFVVSLADSIYPATLLQEIKDFHFNLKPAATIAVSQDLDIAPSHAKLLIKNGLVLEINRVDYRTGPNIFADMGLYVLSPPLTKRIGYFEDLKGGTELIDYLSLMVQEHANIRSVVNAGRWFAFHTPNDLHARVNLEDLLEW